MAQPRTVNFRENMEKFIRKEVVVTTTGGDKIRGICLSFDLTFYNVILMTDECKVMVKNVGLISRQRDHPTKVLSSK